MSQRGAISHKNPDCECPYCTARRFEPELMSLIVELEWASTDRGFSLYNEMARVEALIVDSAIRACGGNKSQAARLLGMERTTLVEKLRKRGLIPPKGSQPCPVHSEAAS